MFFIVNVSTNIFDIILTFMFFNVMMPWKTDKLYQKILLGLFMFFTTLFCNLIIHDGIITILSSIAVLLCVTMGFEGNFTKKILIVCGYMLLVIIADVIVTLILMRFLNADVNTLLNVEGNARMIGMIMSKPILLILVRITGMCINHDEIRLYKQSSILLLTIPFVNIVLLIAIIRFFDNVQVNSTTPVYISSLCILYNTILVFYLFERIMGMTSLQNRYSILENQIIMQGKQAKNEIEESGRIKAFKHDLKIHFQTLYYMIKNGHFSNAEKYLKDTGMVDNISYRSVHTGNIAIDAIFNAKIYEAELSGISVDVDCLLPQDISMTDIDISVLFGNLLDNAIEGCLRANATDSKINIYIRYNRNRLSCCIINTAEENIRKVGNSFISSKSNKKEHGIGISNIRSVVLKYEGICKMTCENGWFKVYMTLFCE